MPQEDEEDPREPLASVTDTSMKEENADCWAEINLEWLS